MEKYFAGEPITIPVKNTKQVKDTAGKVPEMIGVSFNPDEELPISEQEFKHYTDPKVGFKIYKKEVDENAIENITEDDNSSNP